jgi:hypothetical protein
MNEAVMALLRLVHILCGLFWVGAAVMMSRFVFPSIRSSGAAGGAVMQDLIRRKVPIWINVAGGLTMLSGFVMYGGMAAATDGEWARSTPAMVYGLGAIFAIGAAIIAGSRAAPAGKRLGKIGQELSATGSPPNAQQLAEMGKLQDRIASGTRIGMVLLLLAAACMAIARYTA